MVTLSHYIILSALLFTIGIIGVLVRRNALIIFLCIEIMLNAVNLAFIAFSQYYKIATGHIFVFIVITIAAAEAAVGLAIIVNVYRTFKSISVSKVSELKG